MFQNPKCFIQSAKIVCSKSVSNKKKREKKVFHLGLVVWKPLFWLQYSFTCCCLAIWIASIKILSCRKANVSKLVFVNVPGCWSHWEFIIQFSILGSLVYYEIQWTLNSLMFWVGVQVMHVFIPVLKLINTRNKQIRFCVFIENIFTPKVWNDNPPDDLV